ncbi:MAG: bifunctional DNA-formamidopyrimidine glycosylase/DNA-(apurinic or apyrimidinic site) lyase [Bifidobacteriaceae bacterium]|jgi:formamidopyrimidine-DNA glycosylase|nr:bifunctional DNA-formamidopyrimidine glycosylase/DNA-(apurinic or apyrimidinic site) lyase [Bifidobacteriaceae bacterium]
MPELPEVEVIKQGLQIRLIGYKILQVEILSSKSWLISDKNLKNNVLGAKIVSIKRRAKLLIINLDTNYSLIFHLKMTGQLVLRNKISNCQNRDSMFLDEQEANWGGGHPTKSLVGILPDNSTRIIFNLSNGLKLFFNDQRKFGWVKLVKTNDLFQFSFIKFLGPEPFNPEIKADRTSSEPDIKTSAEFLQRIKRHQKTSIKAAILNQKIIAGVGNIYADESLWMSKIHPSQKVINLTDKQLINLLKNIIEVMKLSIKQGGSTARNYVNSEGLRGKYLDFANVYMKEGQFCPRCLDEGREIELIKIKVAGRGTHICPFCQKL